MNLYFLDAKIEFDETWNVIYGTPSHGNIGQLAVDLLITTMMSSKIKDITKIGYIESNLLVPIFGHEEIGGSLETCMPIEVYAITTSKVLIIQQRSPCRPDCVDRFIDEFSDVLRSLSCKNLLVLTGAKPPFNSPRKLFVSSTTLGRNSIPPAYQQQFSFYNFFKTELVAHRSLQDNLATLRLTSELPIETSTLEAENNFQMKIAHRLLCKAETQSKDKNNYLSSIRLLVFGCFSEEGDNTVDGKELLSAFLLSFEPLKGISSTSSTFMEPGSWKYLFGNCARDQYAY